MSNRWLRFGIALLALASAGVAGFRIYQQEQRLMRDASTAHSVEAAAAAALVALSDVQAALHAYVADGQGTEFWTTRAATLIDGVRTSALALDAPATLAGRPMTDTLDLTDRLAAAEQRAREHLRLGERRLAGEVIFTDAGEVVDAMRQQVSQTRSDLAVAAGAQQGTLRREQSVLGLSATGVLAFAVLLLAIPIRSTAPASPALDTQKAPSVSEGSDEFESSARMVARTPAAGGGSGTADASVPAKSAESTPRAARPETGGRVGPSTAAPVAGRPTPLAPPATATISLREAATVCTELGRASQSVEVSSLLDRAARVLSASGVVVWMASPDGRELYPAASSGYDERLLARIGAIPRTAANVTAGALREATPRTAAQVGQSAAALAVPLLTPLGAVGVLSAELRGVTEVDENRLAVATIFAAQLATLVGSMTAAASAARESEHQDAAVR